MGAPETPVPSQADRIEQRITAIETRLDSLTAAFNDAGSNLQWIVDNVQGIFQMFSNPQMMGMMAGMIGGMPAPDLTGEMNVATDGTAVPKS